MRFVADLTTYRVAAEQSSRETNGWALRKAVRFSAAKISILSLISKRQEERKHAQDAGPKRQLLGT